MQPRSLALGVLLLLVACTPTKAPQGPDGGALDAGTPADGGMELVLPTEPTLEQLSAWWDGKVACRLYSCEQHVRQTELTCALAREAEGVPYDSFRRALASVGAGRAHYDATVGKKCAAFLKSIDLTRECFGQGVIPFRDWYGPGFVANCSGLIIGTEGQGEACDDDAECISGASCQFDRTTDCSGQCVDWLEANESCASRPRDCIHGTYCDGSFCKSQFLSRDGVACYDSGESCQSGKCFNNQCKTVSGSGGECYAEGDCSIGLFCRPLPPSTGYLGICQYPAATGAMCGYTVRCAGNQSCPGYFWAYQGGWSEGACADRPKDVGDTCTPIATGYDYGDTGCFMDLNCDPATSKCVEAPAPGEACAMPGSRCGFGAYCDTSAVCRLKKAPGESAESRQECRNEYDSFEKKCYRQADLNRCGLR